MRALLSIDYNIAQYGKKLYSGKVQKAKGTSKGSSGKAVSAFVSGAMIAIARHTRNTARAATSGRSPEVMVKITGGAKSAKHLSQSLAYISRNAKLELETQDGHTLKSKDENEDLAHAWTDHIGNEIAIDAVKGEAGKKHTYNVVLSMPYGTEPEQLKKAAREFAKNQFGDNYYYAMAAHIDDNNPLHRSAKQAGLTTDEVEKRLNPHVHLIVLAKGKDGVRLNPRKADLQLWREGFAQSLKNHGINAAATKREVRQAEKKPPAPVFHMEARGVKPRYYKRSNPNTNPYHEKKQRTQDAIAMRYAGLARALKMSTAKEASGIMQSIGE